MTNYWEQLTRQVQKRNIILLGEMHGADINTKIIDTFVRQLKTHTIMIEVESKWQKIFPLLVNNPKEFIKQLSKEHWITKSGLMGKEHIHLFRKYLKKNKKIVPIKIENRNWNKAEKQTAEAILNYIKKNPKEKTILIIVGNLHARKKPFFLNEKNRKRKFIPLGFLLKKNATTVKIRYGQGEIYNFKNISIKDRGALKYKKIVLQPSFSKYFDWDYIVPEAHPISLLRIK